MVILLSENVAKLGIYLGTAPSGASLGNQQTRGRLISEEQRETSCVVVVDGMMTEGQWLSL